MFNLNYLFIKVTFLIILFFIQSIFCQITFFKTYGDTGESHDDVGHVVMQTEDGGYIIAGEISRYFIYGHPTQYFGDVFLIKTDEYGDMIWGKSYGDTTAFRESAYSMAKAIDGGYLICAYSTEYYGLWIIKTNSNGDSVWTKKLDLGRSLSICTTSDSGFAITGRVKSDLPPEGNMDVYLLKLDLQGNIEWLKKYNKNLDEEGTYVQQTSEGGFIISGITEFPEPRYLDIWIIKTDSQGDTIWTKTYGGDYIDEPHSICETDEDGYFIAGEYTEEGELGLEIHIWLLRTDSNGDTLWTRRINNNSWGDYANACKKTLDGGFIITGETIYDDFDSDIYIIKLDGEFNRQWSSTIGGEYIGCFEYNDIVEYHLRGNDIQETSDGGYVITGFCEVWIGSFDEYLDLCLAKVNNIGQITGFEGVKMEGNIHWELWQNYPNPFNPTTQIKFQLNKKRSVLLTIYDLLGREVITLLNEEKKPGIHTVKWNGKDKYGRTVSSGIYLYRLQSGSISHCKKMVFIK